jgi:hypothetical protein
MAAALRPTTSMVSPSLSLGLNSMTSVPAVSTGVCLGVAERDAPVEHDPPVRRLAAVVGQPLEQRRGVDVLVEMLEPDREPAELLEAALVPRHGLDVGGGLLRDLRHVILLTI